MRKGRLILLALGLYLVAWDTPSNAAPNQMVPNGLGETVTLPGMLSYRAPAGWSTDTETNASPQARGPVSNGVVPDITFNAGNYGALTQLANTYQAELYDTGEGLKIVSQKSFVTSAGVKGVCLQEVEPSSPSKVTQFSYIFLSSDGRQLELACACATTDATVYKPVFDASMKTVVILKGD